MDLPEEVEDGLDALTDGGGAPFLVFELVKVDARAEDYHGGLEAL